MNLLKDVSTRNLKKKVPEFRPGDTVKVHVKVKEGDKERIQIFEGVVIRRRRGDINSTFTVRKVSYGVGVERVFPLHSPTIDRIEVVNAGKVKRSRLYYLRDLSGKAARITSEIGERGGRNEEEGIEESAKAAGQGKSEGEAEEQLPKAD